MYSSKRNSNIHVCLHFPFFHPTYTVCLLFIATNCILMFFEDKHVYILYQLRNSEICIVDYENCNELDKCVTSITNKIGSQILTATSEQVIQIERTAVYCNIGKYWILFSFVTAFVRNSNF